MAGGRLVGVVAALAAMMTANAAAPGRPAVPGAPLAVPAAPAAPSAPAPGAPPVPAPALDPERPLAPPVGTPDINFVNELISQHQDAITTARAILATSKDPDLRRLAQQTIIEREREIARLRDWQQKR